jgi:putative two-component system response regulator
MKQETLLIVEDNDVLRDALVEVLALDGFNVLAASNGREGLEQMEETFPDLIISDVAMPEMDGYTFFQRVRSRSEWLTIPFIFLTARGDKEDILTGKDLGAEDYLVKPLDHKELLTTVRSRLDRSQQLRMVRLKEAYEASLTVLANAIEVRDQYTRGHVERVTAYALALAEQLDWKSAPIEDLRFSAILHDIGKIHISESILQKTGPLTDQEWEEMKKHPCLGADMIKDIPYLAHSIQAIRHHHEKWNGTGYPDGLAGDDIPMPARIIAVADAFDAMTTTRVYRTARSLEDARDEVLSGVGQFYDPKVIEAFKRTWDAGELQAIAAKWESTRLPDRE